MSYEEVWTDQERDLHDHCPMPIGANLSAETPTERHVSVVEEMSINEALGIFIRSDVNVSPHGFENCHKRPRCPFFVL